MGVPVTGLGRLELGVGHSGTGDGDRPISLDFGGKQGAATASGVIDGIGYLGDVLAGDTMARLSVAFGWNGFFIALAGVAFLTSTAGLVFWVREGKR